MSKNLHRRNVREHFGMGRARDGCKSAFVRPPRNGPPAGDDVITIELLALDLLELIAHLKWPEVALLGYSMGGVIAQQLLTLPFREVSPVRLPFTITHVLLAPTRCKVHANTGLRIAPQVGNRPLTPEERKAITRRVVGSLFDPAWIELNPARFELLLNRSIDNLRLETSRYPRFWNRVYLLGEIAKQGAALQKFKFDHLLCKIPSHTRILVVHGMLDQVIPYHCGEEIVNSIPNVRSAELGVGSGQIPSLDFGHYFYQYFDARVWYDLLHNFVEERSDSY
ncbi:Alpha/Beta hydrolase protein [Ephemerocybe angulata]|uniref:Alpha/Beta hydrolase protein n=1 Tax=Ephemerocybe angulata TaxID=980116 RepID=A0A8H6IEG8_9AGAR|nr:Alpha/Beta hydrolase protein [Tulosesus angulatus]